LTLRSPLTIALARERPVVAIRDDGAGAREKGPTVDLAIAHQFSLFPAR